MVGYLIGSLFSISALLYVCNLVVKSKGYFTHLLIGDVEQEIITFQKTLDTTVCTVYTVIVDR